MYHFISKTLGIKDTNIIFKEIVEEKVYKGVNSLFYYGKLTYTPERCEYCGFKNVNFSITKNGTKSSRITLPKIGERPAFLVLAKQRFHCKKCDSHFTAKTPIVEEYCFISNNTRLAVLDKATDIRSEKSISQSCRVSPSTVSRFIDRTANQIKQMPFDTLPEHLMMDEFKSVKNVTGSMSFIFADATTHRIVDIVEDRRLFSLKHYFYRYALKDRKQVKTVTIDMYEPYINLIKHAFPHAEIIIDRFHIIQALNRALNMTRVMTMNTFRTIRRPEYNKCKKYWKLVLKPQETLEVFEYRKVTLFKEWKTEKGVVEHILNLDETLANTYHYVNLLRYALKSNDIQLFNDTLTHIDMTMISNKLKPVIRTLRRHRHFIENTVKFNLLTNGPLEGINNKIKLIKRVSFGYRNFNHLRNRILLCSRLYISGTKKEIKQHSVA